MNTKVYFVRHAQSKHDNVCDMVRELTKKGMEDRKKVSAYLQDKNIEVMFSSPYKRAIDTIKDFADDKQLSITSIADFRERAIGGKGDEDFSVFSRNQWADFSYKLEGGECLGEVQARNIAALEKILADNKGKNIVIGTHGTALSTVVNYFQPSFCFEDYEKIQNIMPWIVVLTFDNDLQCVNAESVLF